MGSGQLHEATLQILQYLRASGPLESRIRESGAEDQEFFQHGVPLPLSMSEEGLLDKLKALETSGLLQRSERVHSFDTSEYLCSWTLTSAGLSALDSNSSYMSLESITPGILKAATVFLRIDTNSTLAQGTVKTNERIVRAARAIRQLAIKHQAKVVVGTHNGRQGELSFVGVGVILKDLRKLLVGDINYIGNTYSGDTVNEETIREIRRLRPGEALILENLRFLPGETKALSPEEHAKSPFIRDLIEKCGVSYFVLDALSVSHRSHRSVVGFSEIPNIAGPNLDQELVAIQELQSYFLKPENPTSVMVLGGTKIQDYFGLMSKALDENLVWRILTGGLLANLCLIARGYRLGAETESRLRRKDQKGRSVSDYLPEISRLLERYPDRFELPLDVVGENLDAGVIYSIDKVPNEFCVFDIGPQTVAKYKEIIRESASKNTDASKSMVYIKGPVGAYDISDEYAYGSRQLLDFMIGEVRSRIFCVVGGGDTTAMLRAFRVPINQIDYVSLAGGALIQLLAGEELPGVAALEKSYQNYSAQLCKGSS